MAVYLITWMVLVLAIIFWWSTSKKREKNALRKQRCNGNCNVKEGCLIHYCSHCGWDDY